MTNQGLRRNDQFLWRFHVRDKVIQTENNYDKDVFNGDIGQIVKIDPVEREVIDGIRNWEYRSKVEGRKCS